MLNLTTNGAYLSERVGTLHPIILFAQDYGHSETIEWSRGEYIESIRM